MSGLALEVLPIPDATTLREVGGTLIQLLIIAAATWLALRLARAAVDAAVRALLDREVEEGTSQELSAIEVEKRKETLRSMGYALLRTFVVIIAALMALRAVSLDIGPAIAGLGIVGLAVGLGAQSLVKDYVAGAFILIENQYAKGDVVKLLDVTGTVEAFTLRRTTLRDFDGTVHTVPNGQIIISSNLTRLWARVTIEMTVPRESDLGRAEAVIEATGKAMKADRSWGRRILEPPRVEHIQGLGESGITLRVSGTVRASDRWAATGELRRRLLAAFAAEGLEVRAG